MPLSGKYSEYAESCISSENFLIDEKELFLQHQVRTIEVIMTDTAHKVKKQIIQNSYLRQQRIVMRL